MTFNKDCETQVQKENIKQRKSKWRFFKFITMRLIFSEKHCQRTIISELPTKSQSRISIESKDKLRKTHSFLHHLQSTGYNLTGVNNFKSVLMKLNKRNGIDLTKGPYLMIFNNPKTRSPNFEKIFIKRRKTTLYLTFTLSKNKKKY